MLPNWHIVKRSSPVFAAILGRFLPPLYDLHLIGYAREHGANPTLTGDCMRRLISSGSTFEKEIGYSRAVVDGDWVFVSGTTGFNYRSMTISDDVVEQAQQCLRNIDDALQEAGSRREDIVRVRYILPRVEDFQPCWPMLRDYFGEVRPAATMIAAGLSDRRMKIEIEVTAKKTPVR